MRKAKPSETDLVVFLGPSFPQGKLRTEISCTVLPPAAHGDVWEALKLRPKAIALVDGVFEFKPSVWHKEILSALSAQVAVFGGASMGALRAVELAPYGMLGVGQVFEWYRNGHIVDDSEVALLHADEEHDFRPLTLPLVNVRFAAEQAVSQKILRRKEAAQLLDAASQCFYQDRTWSHLERKLSGKWPNSTMKAWKAWAAKGLPDLKAQDALACIGAAAKFVKRGAVPFRAERFSESSRVRHRRLSESLRRAEGSENAQEWAYQGTHGLVLARWAKSLGLKPSASLLNEVRENWQERGRADDLDAAQRDQMAEELALQGLMLRHAASLLPDGPSWEEGLVWESYMREDST